MGVVVVLFTRNYRILLIAVTLLVGWQEGGIQPAKN